MLFNNLKLNLVYKDKLDLFSIFKFHNWEVWYKILNKICMYYLPRKIREMEFQILKATRALEVELALDNKLVTNHLKKMLENSFTNYSVLF